MTNTRISDCPEPDGRLVVVLSSTERSTAHDVMLAETGECPWCGGEA